MTKKEPLVEEMMDVPTLVFEKFLLTLNNAGISAELIDQLRIILLEDKKFNTQVLEKVILAEESL